MVVTTGTNLEHFEEVDPTMVTYCLFTYYYLFILELVIWLLIGYCYVLWLTKLAKLLVLYFALTLGYEPDYFTIVWGNCYTA